MDKSRFFQRKPRVAVVIWAVFFAGLLVQALAPRLRIRNNAFVIPPSVAAGKSVRPAEIVERERRMQVLSGILTLGGALGLAFFYREVVIGSARHNREATEVS